MNLENAKTIAVDNGFGVTKSSVNDVKFKSTVKKGEDIYNANVMQVKFNDENYIVGESNNGYIVDSDKLSTEWNRLHLTIATLTSIGLSFNKEKDITTHIALGTPSQYYSNQRDGMAELFKNKEFKIYINKVGFEQRIKIENVLVLPQALAPILVSEEYLNSRVTVIDIGSGTVDVAEVVKGKLIRTLTIEKGCMKLYSKIAQKLNNEYNTKYSADDIIDLISDDYFLANGEKHTMGTYMDSILAEHVEEIMRDIKQADFDLLGTKVVLIGGGAVLLNKHFINHVNHAKKAFSPQTSNVKSFHEILKSKLV